MDKGSISIYCTLDSTGKVLAVNSHGACTLGYAVETLLGSSILDWLEDRDRWEAQLAMLLEQSDPPSIQGTMRFVKPEGKTIPASVTVQPLQGNATLLLIGELLPEAFAIAEGNGLLHRNGDSPHQYQALVDSLDGIVWEVALPSLQFTFVSQKAEDLLGYPVEQWLTEPDFWRNHLHPEDREWAVPYYLSAIETQQSHDFEYRMIGADGQVLWLHDIVTMVVEAGQPVKMRGVMVDITPRKLVEMALQFSEERFRLLAENVQEVFWVMSPDAQRHLYINPMYEKIWGQPCQSLYARSDAWMDAIHPEDRDRVLSLCQQRGRGEIASLDMEFRIIRPDGTIRWIWGRDFSAVNRQGQMTNIVGLAADITERKQAEEQVRFQAALLDNVRESIVATDLEGCIIYWSKGAEALYGYSAQEALGQSVSLIVESQSAEEEEHRIQQVLETGLWRGEYLQQRKDGTSFWADTTISLVRDGNGQPCGIIGIDRDISDRKQAEISLRLQADRERLLGAIARRMHQSLHLDTILKTTVDEIRICLGADRVVVYQFNTGWSGIMTVESVIAPWTSLLGAIFYDSCFAKDYVEAYRQGQVQAIEDIYCAGLQSYQVDLLAQYQVRAMLVAPIFAGEQLWGLLAAHQCDAPRQWQSWEIDLLRQLATQAGVAIQQSQLYDQMRRQAQRETLLNQIVEEIRHSLDLETTLRRTTEAVQAAFQVSRCMAGFYAEDAQVIQYAAIALAEGVPAPCTQQIPVAGNPLLEAVLSQESPLAINDAATASLTVSIQTLLQRLHVKAFLGVSIGLEDRTIGVLSLHQCDRPRAWTDDDKILIKALADQLAVAIQQARLYRQVQQLNATLEQQVQQRTAQLRQALDLESTLKRITDKVRDSLDEAQILETVVRELAIALKVDCCNTGIYNAEQTTSTITHECTFSIPPVQGTVFQMADFIEVYQQLVQGDSVEFCWTQQLAPRSIPVPVSIVACPMQEEQGAFGDLWLFKVGGAAFEEVEIRLIQQVANQCAIAVRQARLYQAVQDQVAEHERLHHLKDDFLSTVSHELRTPMTNIRMATQMLEIVLRQASQSSEVSERAERYFQILRDECQRELSLINDLLDLSRLDAGTKPLNAVPIDLQTWLLRVVEPFKERIQDQKQRLQIELPPLLPPLTTDQSALDRIFAELLQNACKYTPAHETITVAIQVAIDTLSLSVCNSGIEILPEEQSRIFDKFYRIPHRDPWKHGGTGLGLALAKRLVEHLGATIQVQSKANQTCFTVTFPRELS